VLTGLLNGEKPVKKKKNRKETKRVFGRGGAIKTLHKGLGAKKPLLGGVGGWSHQKKPKPQTFMSREGAKTVQRETHYPQIKKNQKWDNKKKIKNPKQTHKRCVLCH